MKYNFFIMSYFSTLCIIIAGIQMVLLPFLIFAIALIFYFRSSVLQREIDNLRRELETANQRTVDCDKAARDAQV